MASRSVNLKRHPLSRTYGAILQSSLTTILPSALDFSSRLPVSGLVRSPTLHPLEAFLGRSSDDFKNLNAFETRGPTDISIRTAHHPNAVPPSVHVSGAGMLTCYPSSTPFGLD